jgi:hypothetical protein
MPESLPRSLSSEEIEAILAHEAIHLERRDNLWGAIHMLVEALFWFHPMVWWVGRRLVVERERACDDAVIQSGHSREVYARAVLESCRLYLRLPFACASGVSSANLADRIEAIMTASAAGQVSTRQKSVLIAAGLLAVAVPLWVGFATAPDLGEARSRMPLASWLFNSGPTTEQIAHDLADEKRPRRQVPYDPARFERFVGDYKFGSYGTMTVSRWRDRFFTQLTGQEVLELYPESDFEFFYKSVPGQISFITDATGRPTALIMHRGGVNQRLPKLGRAGAAELHAALARRIAENQPSPGTEAYVRSFLSSVAADRPDYSGMAPHLAQTAREEWPAQRSALRALGQLKAVRFLRVSPQGADLFEADFEKGRMFLRIAPLERGKAAQIFMRPMS